MSDFQDKLVNEITERLDRIKAELGQFDALVEERARLENTLAALKGQDSSPAPARERAPRGENRKKILDAIGDRPGVSTAEVAEVTGVGLSTVRTTISALKREGHVEDEPSTGGVKLT